MGMTKGRLQGPQWGAGEATGASRGMGPCWCRGKGRVTAPRELAGRFQGVVQISWGLGCRSLALWERHRGLAGAVYQGLLQAFQALRLGMWSDHSCPPPTLSSSLTPSPCLSQLPQAPGGSSSTHCAPLPGTPFPMSLAHLLAPCTQLLSHCHFIQENFACEISYIQPLIFFTVLITIWPMARLLVNLSASSSIMYTPWWPGLCSCQYPQSPAKCLAPEHGAAQQKLCEWVSKSTAKPHLLVGERH